MPDTLIKRVLIAIPALALLVSVIWLHGLYAKIVTALVGVLCVHEMMNAASSVARPMRVIGYTFAVLLYPAYEFVGGQTGVAILLTLCVMTVFTALVFSGRSVVDGLFTVLPMVYPGLFFGSLLDILCTPDPQISRFLMIIAFGCAIITDSFAYFGGLLFGQHELSKAISPKKTVEGAVSGTVFGTAGVVILAMLLQSSFGVHLPAWWYLPLGVVLSVLAQVGDLAASSMKRWFGIKDFGRIMGPHGGAMDRLDSVLFLTPAVFCLYNIMFA
jgi:phosphatidate cytidylyltransferase